MRILYTKHFIILLLLILVKLTDASGQQNFLKNYELSLNNIENGALIDTFNKFDTDKWSITYSEANYKGLPKVTSIRKIKDENKKKQNCFSVNVNTKSTYNRVLNVYSKQSLDFEKDFFFIVEVTRSKFTWGGVTVQIQTGRRGGKYLILRKYRRRGSRQDIMKEGRFEDRGINSIAVKKLNRKNLYYIYLNGKLVESIPISELENRKEFGRINNIPFQFIADYKTESYRSIFFANLKEPLNNLGYVKRRQQIVNSYFKNQAGNIDGSLKQLDSLAKEGDKIAEGWFLYLKTHYQGHTYYSNMPYELFTSYRDSVKKILPKYTSSELADLEMIFLKDEHDHYKTIYQLLDIGFVPLLAQGNKSVISASRLRVVDFRLEKLLNAYIKLSKQNGYESFAYHVNNTLLIKNLIENKKTFSSLEKSSNASGDLLLETYRNLISYNIEIPHEEMEKIISSLQKVEGVASELSPQISKTEKTFVELINAYKKNGQVVPDKYKYNKGLGYSYYLLARLQTGEDQRLSMKRAIELKCPHALVYTALNGKATSLFIIASALDSKRYQASAIVLYQQYLDTQNTAPSLKEKAIERIAWNRDKYYGTEVSVYQRERDWYNSSTWGTYDTVIDEKAVVKSRTKPLDTSGVVPTTALELFLKVSIE